MWWAPILDTVGVDAQPSLYSTVFLNKALANPAESNPEDASFDLTADAQELQLYQSAPAGAKPVLADHLPRVSAALAISAADLVPVVGDLKQAPFKLSTLSELYRTVSLARALGVPTADLAILRTFIGPDPFTPSTPGSQVKNATDFVRLARQLLAANLSLAQLDYLFHDAADAGSGSEIAVATIAATVDQLRAGLKTIAAALAVDENDPNVAAVVRRKLALLLTPAQLNGAIAILEGAPGADYTKVDDDFGVLRTVAPTLDLTPLKSPPADTQPSTIAARYALIRQPLLDYVADRDRQALVRAQVAAAFSVSLPIAVALLDSPFVAPLPATPGTAPLDVLLDPIMLGSDPTLDPTNPDPKTSKLAAQLATVTLLYKQATLATLLKLGADELVFMVAHDDKLGWVDLRLLPIDGLSTTIGDDQLRGLFDYLQLRKRQPANAPPLLDVFGRAIEDASATVDDLLVDIAKRTGWDEPVNGVAPISTRSPRRSASPRSRNSSTSSRWSSSRPRSSCSHEAGCRRRSCFSGRSRSPRAQRLRRSPWPATSVRRRSRSTRRASGSPSQRRCAIRSARSNATRWSHT